MRHWWFVLIAAQLVGLAAIMWSAPTGADGAHQAASRGMSNPFVLAASDDRTLAPRVARVIIEIRSAHCAEGCTTVLITLGDRIRPRHEKV